MPSTTPTYNATVQTTNNNPVIQPVTPINSQTIINSNPEVPLSSGGKLIPGAGGTAKPVTAQNEKLAIIQASQQQKQSNKPTVRSGSDGGDTGVGEAGSEYSKQMALRSSPSDLGQTRQLDLGNGMFVYQRMDSVSGKWINLGQPQPYRVTASGGNAGDMSSYNNPVTLPDGTIVSFGNIDQPVLKYLPATTSKQSDVVHVYMNKDYTAAGGQKDVQTAILYPYNKAVYDPNIGTEDTLNPDRYAPVVLSTGGYMPQTGYVDKLSGVYHMYTVGWTPEQYAAMYGISVATAKRMINHVPGEETTAGDLNIGWDYGTKEQMAGETAGASVALPSGSGEKPSTGGLNFNNIVTPDKVKSPLQDMQVDSNGVITGLAGGTKPVYREYPGGLSYWDRQIQANATATKSNNAEAMTSLAPTVSVTKNPALLGIISMDNINMAGSNYNVPDFFVSLYKGGKGLTDFTNAKVITPAENYLDNIDVISALAGTPQSKNTQHKLDNNTAVVGPAVERLGKVPIGIDEAILETVGYTLPTMPMIAGGAGIMGSMAVQNPKGAAGVGAGLGAGFVSGEVEAFNENPVKSTTLNVINALMLADAGNSVLKDINSPKLAQGYIDISNKLSKSPGEVIEATLKNIDANIPSRAGEWSDLHTQTLNAEKGITTDIPEIQPFDKYSHIYKYSDKNPEVAPKTDIDSFIRPSDVNEANTFGPSKIVNGKVINYDFISALNDVSIVTEKDFTVDNLQSKVLKELSKTPSVEDNFAVKGPHHEDILSNELGIDYYTKFNNVEESSGKGNLGIVDPRAVRDLTTKEVNALPKTNEEDFNNVPRGDLGVELNDLGIVIKRDISGKDMSVNEFDANLKKWQKFYSGYSVDELIKSHAEKVLERSPIVEHIESTPAEPDLGLLGVSVTNNIVSNKTKNNTTNKSDNIVASLLNINLDFIQSNREMHIRSNAQRQDTDLGMDVVNATMNGQNNKQKQKQDTYQSLDFNTALDVAMDLDLDHVTKQKSKAIPLLDFASPQNKKKKNGKNIGEFYLHNNPLASAESMLDVVGFR